MPPSSESSRPSPFNPVTFTYRHRVRYRECDPMGIVYHAHYVDYFEAARTEALRMHGLPYKQIEDAGVIMPVVEMHVRYHQPAHYDDLLDVLVRFPEPPGVRIPIEYEVRRADDPTLLVTGTVVLCFFDTARRRPVPAPEIVEAAFARAADSQP